MSRLQLDDSFRAYCATHRRAYAGTACPMCAADSERDSHYTQRLNTLRHALDQLSARTDADESGINELSARILAWEDAHNALVTYTEALERQLETLRRRVAELELRT